MTFVSTDPQSRNSENTWFTPKVFIDALGPFDLDPCTVSFRPFDTAKNHFQHDLGDDGLILSWFGDVWLNPPYGKEIGPFIKKFITHLKGCLLIFARMGSEHIQRLIESGASIFLLRKRINFLSKDHKNRGNAGADSLIAFYDKKYIQRLVNSEIKGVLIQGYNSLKV